ncbi:MAG: sodium:proline symporter [Gemmatimonadales bacterium]|nr:sodium:proline symporter [Gemmatimonadales bacterium]NIN10875.1 sodium:proline symporter [Gemmatimonadales bacterium]NIR02883.1 sodium:proline symporter [Gemmatimonadales bacterium]NIS66517.1 sodium:proline symporter [Gemmatimonadales bacterium]
MAPLDWAIVAGYLIFAIAVGFVFRRRAGRNISQYFLSGRNLPWWILGTSIVATMFAADTPLAVTGLVANDGIAGLWFMWNFAAAHLMATFFFARLWRRAGVITDVELVELRYSGRPARVLRGFRSVWEGVVLNCIIMGWVILAMVKIMDVLVSLDTVTERLGIHQFVDGRWFGILVCLVVAVAYTVLSGFWGVVMTDFVQFVLAMAGAIALAVIAVGDIGGIAALKARLVEQYGELADGYLSFTPDMSSSSLPLITFVALVGVNWWATRDAGGTSYMVQRMLAAKNEQHSFLGVLWFCFAHYVLRPWPWIIVGLLSLVVFPGLEDKELGYPMMIVEYMPTGLLGLMLASILAAFMSTIDTLLNWGTSLMVNDCYKPFIVKRASDRHYVRVSQLVVVSLMIVGGLAAYTMQSIRGAWELFFGMTVGIGGVYVMRWWWWRVNAWSEIAAWVSTAVVYVGAYVIDPDLVFGWHLIITAGLSTVCWVAVTLVTPPTDERKLIEFYERVRPGSPWWQPVARRSSVPVDRMGWSDIRDWCAGLVFIYAGLFAVGKLILEGWSVGLVYLGIASAAGIVIYRSISRSTSA